MYRNISLSIKDAPKDHDGNCHYCEENAEAKIADYFADITYAYIDYPGGPYTSPNEVCRKHLIDIVENFRDMER
jgi:hypothetical protein